MIIKKINKKIFINKLNAMYDYLIQLQVNNKDNVILLEDRHGIEEFTTLNLNTRYNSKRITIKHNIDRRELIKKLKSMTELIIKISFDDIFHKITLQGITTNETSIYYCISDNATTKEQTYGIFNWFK